MIDQAIRYKHSNTIYNVPNCVEYELIERGNRFVLHYNIYNWNRSYAQCSKCDNKYHISGDRGLLENNKVNIVCHKDIDNCLEYDSKSDNLNCTKCNDKYFVNINGTKCLPLGENCTKMSNNDCS